MNIVILGPARVSEVPEVKTVGVKNTRMVSVVVETDEGYEGKDGRVDRLMMHEVHFFGDKGPANAALNLKPGDVVVITGALNSREHQGKYYADCRGLSIERVCNASPPAPRRAATAASAEDTNDDIPF